MKTLTTYTMTALLALGLLAGCSPETDEQTLAAPEAAAPAAPAAGVEGAQRDNAGTTSASATGTVQAVDASAGTVTIDHGPVDALQWPAMTMTFQAPGIDLESIEEGDEVSFDFTSTGMDGTITAISSQ